MKKGTIIGLSVLGVVVILAVSILGWGFSAYNSLVTQEENIHSKAATVDVQLQRRSDLIPNLVNTVKAYAAHEEEIFTAVSEARTKLAGSTTMDEKIEADSELTSALNRLLAISEAYPDLKANQNFIALQDELEGTENRIATARRDYNEAVQQFNTSLRRFPTSIIAGMFGFEKAPLFQASESANSVPQVNFD